MSLATRTPKRLFVGRPLRSNQLSETLLPKKLALPLFCSDPLSSVAYATEEILLVLSLGGVVLLQLSWYVAAVIVALLAIVVASYRQTCRAYPNGGGAYVVASINLGATAGLAAASALLVDYVLTVAVSVVAGVAAITSAAPALAPHAVALSVGFVVLLTVTNLRGVRESGRAFAIPTYGFVLGIYVMFAVAVFRFATGEHPQAMSAQYPVHPEAHFAGLALLLLAMRAFASGCTALTGVEAISNGVPAFKKPTSKNAADTLAIMGALSISMFAGITALALLYHVHAAANPMALGLPAGASTPTVLAQVAHTTFGGGFFYYYVQAFTAGILILAANTAFNGFPLLASILAHDRYLPRQLHNRGDRLVFSNGIILLAGAAVALIIVFKASTTAIIQLYIIGVFLSFTLSQAGMVKHWQTDLQRAGAAGRASIRRSQVINATGALFTGVVLVIVLITKFSHGAWIVTIAIPLLFLMMRAIRRHYDRVAAELAVPDDAIPERPARNHALVLVSKVHAPTMRALGYAESIRPDDLTAVTVAADTDDSAALQREWQRRELDIPLLVLDSPYREISRPFLDFVKSLRRQSPRDVVTVFIPEYVVGRWWQQVLHNQSALRLKARLLFTPGLMVTSVPYQLAGARELSRPAATPGAAGKTGRPADRSIDGQLPAATPVGRAGPERSR